MKKIALKLGFQTPGLKAEIEKAQMLYRLLYIAKNDEQYKNLSSISFEEIAGEGTSEASEKAPNNE